MEFVGKSMALTSDGFSATAEQLGVKAPEIWTVLSVETHGTGFLPDRRPQILFERHIFSRLTGNRYDGTHPEVSAREPGGYGPCGGHQYDRLAEALSLDRAAALMSASWGLAQIMGSNFAAAGFIDVEEMVAAMCDSEDSQLKSMSKFLISSGLRGYLASHDWTSFARGYNGPNYATNRYDIELNGFYQKYSVAAMPDLTVRAAQTYLEFRGYDPHGIDGILGRSTQDALKAFQQAVGLMPSGMLDGQTFEYLLPT